MIALSVPIGIGFDLPWSGTGIITPERGCFHILWLPFWRESTKPCLVRMRMTFPAVIGFIYKTLSCRHWHAHLIYDRISRASGNNSVMLYKFFKPKLQHFTGFCAGIFKCLTECDTSWKVRKRNIITAFFSRIKYCKIGCNRVNFFSFHTSIVAPIQFSCQHEHLGFFFQLKLCCATRKANSTEGEMEFFTKNISHETYRYISLRCLIRKS